MARGSYLALCVHRTGYAVPAVVITRIVAASLILNLNEVTSRAAGLDAPREFFKLGEVEGKVTAPLCDATFPRPPATPKRPDERSLVPDGADRATLLRRSVVQPPANGDSAVECMSGLLRILLDDDREIERSLWKFARIAALVDSLHEQWSNSWSYSYRRS